MSTSICSWASPRVSCPVWAVTQPLCAFTSSSNVLLGFYRHLYRCSRGGAAQGKANKCLRLEVPRLFQKRCLEAQRELPCRPRSQRKLKARSGAQQPGFLSYAKGAHLHAAAGTNRGVRKMRAVGISPLIRLSNGDKKLEPWKGHWGTNLVN